MIFGLNLAGPTSASNLTGLASFYRSHTVKQQRERGKAKRKQHHDQCGPDEQDVYREDVFGEQDEDSKDHGKGQRHQQGCHADGHALTSSQFGAA